LLQSGPDRATALPRRHIPQLVSACGACG
jgi:uncharacterized protein (UPF0261 family)